jgi:phenylacetate-CoA ligase
MQLMKEGVLNLYHRLPPPARSAVASIRGFQLSRWRYGAETDSLASGALERERWSQLEWKNWQGHQLTLLLRRAATRVPYYREYWAMQHRQGNNTSWDSLESWPILDKEQVRENPKAFIADDCKHGRMFRDHTSGTTGKSLDLWFSKSAVRSWYALFEARCRAWYGVSRHDRWAILGGQLIIPAKQRQPPFWVWNAGLKQLYMSSYHLAPDLVPAYLDALRRYRVNYLLGYPSALFELAQGILHSGRSDIKMSVVIANAEPIFDYQKDLIAEAFQCPVRETYGMAEAVCAASECEAGSLHLWPDAGVVEVLEGDAPAAAGELVATGLINFDMPLIRYRVGDLITMQSSNVSCVCGRSLPSISTIDGRLDDVLYTSDGRRIGRLDPVFKSDLPIREAQVIQETLDTLRVNYVPTSAFTVEAGKTMTKRLRARMGDVKVILTPVDAVPRDANGKFRAVVNKLA